MSAQDARHRGRGRGRRAAGRALAGAAALGLAAALGPAAAQEPEKTAEEWLAEAAPVLHHSCRSLQALHADDEEALHADIRLMVAVSVINRDIDLVAAAPSDEEVAAMRAEFADELGDRCARDLDGLVAGFVDAIVAELAATYD